MICVFSCIQGVCRMQTNILHLHYSHKYFILKLSFLVWNKYLKKQDTAKDTIYKIQILSLFLGHYTFSVSLRSDSYLGMDYMEDIKLDVQEAREAVTDHPQWEFEDDEEEEGSKDEDSDEEFATDDEFDEDDED